MANLKGSAQFPPDPVRESDFNRRGWKFTRNPRIVLAGLTTVEECQVRGVTDRQDPHIVTRYSTAMAAGAEFPAGVVAQVKQGDQTVTTIVDFHHRVAAALENGRTTLPAYVLTDVEPLMLKAYALRSNRHHGKELSDDEALAAVGQLVEGGMAVEAVVRETGLSRSKIDRAVHAYRFATRVEQLTMDLSDDETRRLNRLGVTARAEMARKLEHDPIFTETLRLVLDSGMTGTEASALTKQVATAKSDADAEALLHTERSLRSEAINRIAAGFVPQRVSAIQSFRMHAGALVSLDPTAAVDHNPSTRETTAKMARELLAFAQAVVNGYGAEGQGDAAVTAA